MQAGSCATASCGPDGVHGADTPPPVAARQSGADALEHEEASGVFARMLARFETSTEPWAKEAVALARRWLEAAASDD